MALRKAKKKASKGRKNIVVIGGGTGTFTVLSGLKNYPYNLAAIVTMSDDGGSTGMLRDELGVLPPGDVRQCLVALSSSDSLMRTLMNYRFSEGSLKGHSFGNLLLSALEKITGSFDEAVEKTSEVLRVRGRVIPSTLSEVSLVAHFGKRVVRGQAAIHLTNFGGKLSRISLSPRASANPKAIRAIRDADVIVIGPGDFYSSLVPNLLVKGLPEAICKSKAKKVFVCNLTARAEHTPNFSVADYTTAIERFLGGAVHTIIYNNKLPSAALTKRYARTGELLTSWSALPKNRILLGEDLVGRVIPPAQKGDTRRERAFIRHDPSKLAAAIVRQIRS